MNPIKHEDYEKMADDVYTLGQNSILRINVNFAKKLKDRTRYSYHNEYQYPSDKYIDKSKLITIRRSFDYFLTLENLKPIEGASRKESIMIRVQDMIFLQEILEEGARWFRSEKFRNLFAIKENKLVMLGRVKPLVMDRLPLDKYIKLEPIIMNREDGNTESGIRLTMSQPDNYVDMTLDKYMGLVYVVRTMDMFGYAQNMLNYIGRPEPGENLHIFDRQSDYDVEVEGFIQTNTEGRKIEPKNKSFFNKMDNL